MKKLLFIFCLFLFGCSDKSNPEVNNSTQIPPDLIGKWKIVEIYESVSGFDPTWRDESTTYSYNIWFKSNSEYIRDEGYLNGTYKINNDSLTFHLTSTQNSQTVLIEYPDSDTLIIDFLNFEPVKHKYYKISSEGE